MLVLCLLAVALAGCTPATPEAPANPSAATPPVRADSVLDLADVFAAYDARGTFVLYDAANDRWLRHDAARAAERFTPASTFKVYNALVALDASVVPDVDTVFAWDGVERRIPAWNRDHSLRSGMAVSAVWLYQEVARRNGEARFAGAMAREPYGNSDRTCGLDRFWLDDCLRISADEQVLFLDRLRQGALPFRPEAQAAVRDILRLEAGDGYALYGKTGWNQFDDGRPDIGWLVGWVERPEGAYVFALNLEAAGPSFDMMAARRGVLFGALGRLGLRPPRPDDPAPTAAPDAGAGGVRTGPLLRPTPPLDAPVVVAPPDAWLARDKALHLGVSFLLALSTQYVLTSKADVGEGDALPFAAGFTLAVGVGKEVADGRRGRFPLFSWRDLAADALGVALAAAVIAW